MPKAESYENKDGQAVLEKPKTKAKRLTAKAVWEEVGVLKQNVEALDAKATGLAQALDGIGQKIEASQRPVNDVQTAQQVSSLASGVQSLNGNYLRQVDEMASLRRSISEMGGRIDTLTASTRLVEESCGAISIEVDGLKEQIEMTSKKVGAMEESLNRLESGLKRGYWMVGLVVGAIIIAAVIAASLLL